MYRRETRTFQIVRPTPWDLKAYTNWTIPSMRISHAITLETPMDATMGKLIANIPKIIRRIANRIDDVKLGRGAASIVVSMIVCLLHGIFVDAFTELVRRLAAVNGIRAGCHWEG